MGRWSHRRGWRAGTVTAATETRRLRIHVAGLDARVSMARADLERGFTGPETVLAAMRLREQAAGYLQRLLNMSERSKRRTAKHTEIHEI